MTVIGAILRDLVAAGETALVTRVSPGKAAAVARFLGEGDAAPPPLTHHPEARCLTAPDLPPANYQKGSVMVVAEWVGSGVRGSAKTRQASVRTESIIGAIAPRVWLRLQKMQPQGK